MKKLLRLGPAADRFAAYSIGRVILAGSAVCGDESDSSDENY